MRLHHVQVSMPRGCEPLAVASVAELERLAEIVAAAGFEVSWAERETLEGYARFHCRDGFGNRVEVLAPFEG